MERGLLRVTVDELWWVGFYRQAIRESSLQFKMPVMKGKIGDYLGGAFSPALNGAVN